jgi:serine/threonine protein phosphatase PrpC
MGSYVLRRVVMSLVSPIPASPEGSIMEILQDGVQEAHRSILREVPGGGTTLTSILIVGQQVYYAHVGDSRAYNVEPDGTLRVLTRDHSLVNKLIEMGQLTSEEASLHPQRNVLYRALGQGEPFDADVDIAQVSPSSHLLICSDGLWGQVPEAEIVRIISADASPIEACQRLVDAANSAGGPDNITAILVKMPA